jgi:hypothetical protein
MEVLCTLPCGGRRREDNGRQVWDRGASVIEMQADFMVSKADLRAALDRLAKTWMVRTGNVAPVNLSNGTTVRGGHCAFVEPFGWNRVQWDCLAYLLKHGE